jgi:hypothetical protein
MARMLPSTERFHSRMAATNSAPSTRCARAKGPRTAPPATARPELLLEAVGLAPGPAEGEQLLDDDRPGPDGGQQQPDHDELDDRVGRHEELKEGGVHRSGQIRMRYGTRPGAPSSARAVRARLEAPATARAGQPVCGKRARAGSLMVKLLRGAGQPQMRAPIGLATAHAYALPASIAFEYPFATLRSGPYCMQCGGIWACARVRLSPILLQNAGGGLG